LQQIFPDPGHCCFSSFETFFGLEDYLEENDKVSNNLDQTLVNLIIFLGLCQSPLGESKVSFDVA